jgi:ferredoxin
LLKFVSGEKMTKIPRVNKHECCGCGLCVIALPEVFRLTPEGFSEAYRPKAASEKEIQQVINECPIGCVHWYEMNSD